MERMTLPVISCGWSLPSSLCSRGIPMKSFSSWYGLHHLPIPTTSGSPYKKMRTLPFCPTWDSQSGTGWASGVPKKPPCLCRPLEVLTQDPWRTLRFLYGTTLLCKPELLLLLCTAKNTQGWDQVSSVDCSVEKPLSPGTNGRRPRQFLDDNWGLGESDPTAQLKTGEHSSSCPLSTRRALQQVGHSFQSSIVSPSWPS